MFLVQRRQWTDRAVSANMPMPPFVTVERLPAPPRGGWEKHIRDEYGDGDYMVLGHADGIWGLHKIWKGEIGFGGDW